MCTNSGYRVRLLSSYRGGVGPSTSVVSVNYLARYTCKVEEVREVAKTIILPYLSLASGLLQSTATSFKRGSSGDVVRGTRDPRRCKDSRLSICKEALTFCGIQRGSIRMNLQNCGLGHYTHMRKIKDIKPT